MRRHGQVSEVPEPSAREHVCWVYRDDAELHSAGMAFLAGGLARGERLLCVGDRLAAGLRADPAALGGIAGLVAAGTLRVLTFAEAYEVAGEFSAENQWAFYDAATRRALADGYTGLRVLADVSPLAGDPVLHDELVRWEHVADQFMATGPGMSAMCAYRSDLPESALADVTAVHPLVRSTAATAFRLFFDGKRLVLAGDVDTLGAERLTRALGCSPAHPGTHSLDLAELQFADVAAIRVLAAWARSVTDDGGEVQLWNAPALLRRTWRLLGLDEWARVSFAAAA
ncbi:MEDS domain-containing protein [Blastococcus sp. LR1]|uniref:MEDS domain-containing protein n=1 Tax=Blastococcus sp. LR1 TaxID=2877000 RepID=UPI001CCA2DE7|nr:MEDS domain-containing protein [Blastococcus sp. LR1]MCA0145178.1 MEDS domain-containing protein [Blastococcus sp. LR1]